MLSADNDRGIFEDQQSDQIAQVFWSIWESEEFREKFQNCHPIIEQNGHDFYRIKNLHQRLMVVQAELLKAKTPRSILTLRNSSAALKDWIKQAEWIERHMNQMTFGS